MTNYQGVGAWYAVVEIGRRIHGELHPRVARWRSGDGTAASYPHPQETKNVLSGELRSWGKRDMRLESQVLLLIQLQRMKRGVAMSGCYPCMTRTRNSHTHRFDSFN